MKRRDKGIDIFSLSFLDIISCGFGAVVMLILISKTDVDVAPTAGTEDVSAMLSQLVTLQNSVSQIQQEMNQKLDALSSLSEQKQSADAASKALQQQLNALNK